MSDEQQSTASVVKDVVAAAVAASLGDPVELVRDVVKKALDLKVNDRGDKDDYSRSSRPYLEWACERAIRREVEAGIRKWIEANTTSIQAAVVEQMQGRADGFAASIVQRLADGVKNFYVGVDAKVELVCKEQE